MSDLEAISVHFDTPRLAFLQAILFRQQNIRIHFTVIHNGSQDPDVIGFYNLLLRDGWIDSLYCARDPDAHVHHNALNEFFYQPQRPVHSHRTLILDSDIFPYQNRSTEQLITEIDIYGTTGDHRNDYRFHDHMIPSIVLFGVQTSILNTVLPTVPLKFNLGRHRDIFLWDTGDKITDACLQGKLFHPTRSLWFHVEMLTRFREDARADLGFIRAHPEIAARIRDEQLPILHRLAKSHGAFEIMRDYGILTPTRYQDWTSIKIKG